MTWERTLLVGLIVFLTGAHYVLAWLSIQDVVRRPSVRGGSKTAWGLVILILPIGGSVLYGIYGPTSFLPRDRVPDRRIVSLEEDDFREDWTRRPNPQRDGRRPK